MTKDEYRKICDIASTHGIDSDDFIMSASEMSSIFSFVLNSWRITKKLRNSILSVFRTSRVSNSKDWSSVATDRVLSWQYVS